MNKIKYDEPINIFVSTNEEFTHKAFLYGKTKSSKPKYYDLKDRYRLEEGLISTIYHDKDFLASDKWLGKYSPVSEVRDSHMWVAKGLDKKQLTLEECRKIVTLCIKSNEEAESYQ